MKSETLPVLSILTTLLLVFGAIVSYPFWQAPYRHRFPAIHDWGEPCPADLLFSADLAGRHPLECRTKVTAGSDDLWINLPVLSHTEDTVFFVSYGESKHKLKVDHTAIRAPGTDMPVLIPRSLLERIVEQTN